MKQFIRMCRWPRMLVLAIGLTYVWLPSIVANSPLFAQTRDGKEWGQLMCPLLCCGDAHVPSLPWYIALPVMLLVIAFFIAMAVESEREEKERAKRDEEERVRSNEEHAERERVNNEFKERGEWLVGKQVSFQDNGFTWEGRVVDQQADQVTVNYLTADGTLGSVRKSLNDVVVK